MHNKDPILYGQAIKVDDGILSVGRCPSPSAAVEAVVRFARHAKKSPPKWWQFWLPRWPAKCVAEFERQEAQSYPCA